MLTNEIDAWIKREKQRVVVMFQWNYIFFLSFIVHRVEHSYYFSNFLYFGLLLFYPETFKVIIPLPILPPHGLQWIILAFHLKYFNLAIYPAKSHFSWNTWSSISITFILFLIHLFGLCHSVRRQSLSFPLLFEWFTSCILFV